MTGVLNIGYNTQNEDKQNTQHKHRKLTGQPGMDSCKHWIQYTERWQTKQNTQHKHQCLQLPIPGCPVSFLCLCYVFCLSSFCVLYPMFTAAHSWLSCQFCMFVLCILFVFVLCIVSNAIHRTKTNKIHNTNIENWRDNQEWAAVNIGYNTQNDDKQNKIHNTNIENWRDNQEWAAVNIGYNTAAHSWLSRRFSMFVLCILFCLSSFCVLYPMFTAAHSWLSRQFSMFVLCILFCLSSFCVLYPIFTAAHSWLSRQFYTERRKTKYTTQT
jgi:ABC-type transport system involved in cytochrome bd biosynthesis fused ATPase/permease subunit